MILLRNHFGIPVQRRCTFDRILPTAWSPAELGRMAVTLIGSCLSGGQLPAAQGNPFRRQAEEIST
jgi:hypothetical protein